MTIELLINLLFIVGAIIVLYYMYKRGKVNAVKQVLYELVAKCEILISEEDDDDIYYDLVIDKVYPKLPIVIRTLITGKELDDILHKVIGELKSYLQVNKLRK